MFLKPANSKEVGDIILGLKNNSACGVDRIDVNTITNASVYIAAPLVHGFWLHKGNHRSKSDNY